MKASVDRPVEVSKTEVIYLASVELMRLIPNSNYVIEVVLLVLEDCYRS